jgi:8-oxo-dGTP pyrophosphatase MutT (NUDIX family)
VRILCIVRSRLLLLKWHDTVSGRIFYEPPGGGVEPGESLIAAAKRELWEETGIRAPLFPRFLPVDRDYWWLGRHYVHTEAFFLALPSGDSVTPARLTGEEVQTTLGWQWVDWQASPAVDSPLEPPELFRSTRDLLALNGQ